MLTQRMADPFALARELHDDQTRKGTTIPYLSHLMAVSALVLEYGGDEDAAIAALLHDAVEDRGGLAIARQIADTFGSQVAALVMACSDAAPTPETPKSPWLLRKQAFIAKASRLSLKAALIVTCDKIHNLTCLLRDVQREGLGYLARFAEPDRLAWYFSSLAQALAPFASTAPVQRLLALSRQFQAMVGLSGELDMSAHAQ